MLHERPQLTTLRSFKPARLIRWLVLGITLTPILPGLAGAELLPVGQEFQVNTFTTFRQRFPAVALAPDGNFVVVWASDFQESISDSGVFAQRYDSAGTALGGEFRVNTYTTGFQMWPVVAMDDSGNFVVVWTSMSGQDGDWDGIFGQRYDSAGTPQGSEFQVNTYTTRFQRFPAVSMGVDGEFVVVWEGHIPFQNPNSRGVFGQRFGSGGMPEGGEFQVSHAAGGNGRWPAVALGGDGRFVVVWQGKGPGDVSVRGVFGQRYHSTGAKAGAEFSVNTYTTSPQDKASVAMDAWGNVVVVWRSYGQDGDSWGIFGQRYDNTGASLGSEFQVNTYTTNSQEMPAVATEGAGGFIVTWQSYIQDGTWGSIFARRYDSTGTGLGGEFKVNTYDPGLQEYAQVALNNGGNLVIVWENSGGGNWWEEDDISGQRYALCDARPLPCANQWIVEWFSCDMGHENSFLLERDGTPVCGSANCPGPPDSCWGGPVTERSFSLAGVISWTTDALGRLRLSHEQDVQVYGESFLLVQSPQTLIVPTVADVGRIWLNDIDVTGSGPPGSVTLNLEAGWNHLEWTSYNQNQSTSFELDFPFAQYVHQMSSAPSTCGDMIVDGCEDCDDGNTDDGDCCSSACTYEVAGCPCTSDGNVCTHDRCDGAGVCTHIVDPSCTSTTTTTSSTTSMTLPPTTSTTATVPPTTITTTSTSTTTISSTTPTTSSSTTTTLPKAFFICKQQKAKAAGLKTLKLLNAFAKNRKKPNVSKLAQNISKAQSKFTKAFMTAEERAAKNGASCDDAQADRVEAVVDSCIPAIVGEIYP